MTTNSPTPITVIAGSLGAGKTTVFNYLLCNLRGKRLAIMVNDFGSANLDTRLIAGVAKRIVRLANGCICCSIREEFHNVLKGLVDLPEQPDLILIEASGVADPRSIEKVCSTPDLRRKAYLDAIITIVNAKQIVEMTGEISQLTNIQVRAADIVLLNKIDLVSPEQLAAARSRIRQFQPEAPIFDVTYGRAPLEILLPGESRFEQPSPPHFILNTWTYRSMEPFDLEALHSTLHHLPDTIYRVEGYIYLDRIPKTRVFLHLVGKRLSIIEGGHWADIPRTRLAFTGAWGDDQIPSLLRDGLDACKVEQMDTE